MTHNNNAENDARVPPATGLPGREASPVMDDIPMNNAITGLLKTPASLVRRINEDDSLPGLALQLLFWGLLFHAAYGFAMALFTSSQVALVTACKAPIIALCSILLCIPSLYVFSCVAGRTVSLTQTLALGSATVAMTGLLLIGLTPISWLFSVSTSSLRFVVLMNVTAWAISVSFCSRIFRILGAVDPRKGLSGSEWWLIIYIVVSLQMATTMRPLLTISDAGWREPEKKFFLAHFGDSMRKQQNRGGANEIRSKQ